jgi:3-hydroxy-9,10-secoandrosta-1,3,5(10)-triene-9,17-dione monooxygenase
VLNILGAHTWRLAHFPPAAANDVWSQESSQSDLIAASFPSQGQVEPVDGGYRIRGRWPFASGVDHAGWSYLAVDVPLHNGARNLQHTFLVPRTDYRIEDVWHAAGLKGTGTNLIVVDDAYVPEHRTLCEADNFLQWPGPNAAVDEDAYRYPWGMILAYSVAIPGVGLARAAVDLYRRFVRDKTWDRNGNPFAQRRLAEAETLVDVVTNRMRRNLMEFSETHTANGEALMAARARIRWEASWSVARCADVVREIYEAMGGRAVFSTSPIRNGRPGRVQHQPDPAPASRCRSRPGAYD